MKKFLGPFLFLAVSWTIVCGLIYAAVQQNYRQSANDPQIADIQDVTAALNAGQQLNLAPDGTNLNTSMSTFIVLFDKNGNSLGSNALLDGTMPKLPQGIFKSYKNSDPFKTFTWQPEKGIREAVVLGKVSSTGQYVAIGRSLKQIEFRENDLAEMVATGWIFLILLSLFSTYFFFEEKTKSEEVEEYAEAVAEEATTKGKKCFKKFLRWFKKEKKPTHTEVKKDESKQVSEPTEETTQE